MRLLKSQDNLQEERVKAIREKVLAGVESAKTGTIDGDEVFEKLSMRIDAIEKKGK